MGVETQQPAVRGRGRWADRSPARRGWQAWVDRRGDGVSPWAFVANRVAGLVLVAYLYLHLVVLSTLVRGDEAWDAFLRVAGHPVVLVVDLVLVAAVLWHAANGIRLALVGAGVAVRRQRALLGAVAAVLVVGVTVAAVTVLGHG